MTAERPSRHGEAQGSLPYRFHAKDLLTGAETLRVHGAENHAFEAALRSKASYVKTGMDLLGLLEPGTLELTGLGRDLAYGRQDGTQQRAFLRVILGFDPFRIALTHFVASRMEISDTDSIAAYWGRLRVGASDKNRSEGALVFSHLCQAAGVGKLVVGRSGEKSRIQWDPGASAQLEASNGTPSGLRTPAPVPAAEVSPPRSPEPLSRRAPSVPEVESFRLVTRRGDSGRLELPTSVDQEDLRGLQAQIEAVFAFVRARMPPSVVTKLPSEQT
jgi:hypothetical protein